MAEENLDEFLGVQQQPAWKRYAKWGVIALVVLAMVLLLSRCFGGTAEAKYATEKAERGRLTTTVSATVATKTV